MQLLVSSHPVQVQQVLPNDGIIMEHLIKLAQLEEQNLIIIRPLNLPILMHGRRECFPLLLRDVQGCRVVLGMVRPPLLRIHNILLPYEQWEGTHNVPS